MHDVATVTTAHAVSSTALWIWDVLMTLNLAVQCDRYARNNALGDDAPDAAVCISSHGRTHPFL